MPSILPKLNFEEALEVTQIYSICGKVESKNPMIIKRPFRNPHHSITTAAMIGGGTYPKPGEISLAHNGVLFLDELPEFKNQVLESLREPLEERKITLNRNLMNITYPCNFTLIASMNPCPCGYYGVNEKCKCTEKQINNYRRKISGPLLDRIDIQISVQTISYNKLTSKNKIETSQCIRNRVERTRKIQKERYKKIGIYTNSELTIKELEKYCILNEKSKKILEKAYKNLNLTTRSYSKILKVARTIADIEESEKIKEHHILEAISYRGIER